MGEENNSFKLATDKVTIYLEDYVKSFLYIQSHELDKEESSKMPFRIIPLYGAFAWMVDGTNVYIQGAAKMQFENRPDLAELKKLIENYRNTYFSKLEIVGLCVISNDRSGYINLSQLLDMTEKILGEGKGIILIKDRNTTAIRPFVCLEDGIREIDEYLVYYSKNGSMQEYMLDLLGEKEEKEKSEDIVTINAEVTVEPDQDKKPQDIHLNRAFAICMILGIIAGILVLYYIKTYDAGYMELRTSLKHFAGYKLGRY